MSTHFYLLRLPCVDALIGWEIILLKQQITFYHFLTSSEVVVVVVVVGKEKRKSSRTAASTVIICSICLLTQLGCKLEVLAAEQFICMHASSLPLSPT